MIGFITDENQVENIDGITNEFPYTMHARDLTNFTVPWHWHEEVECNYVAEGSITIDTVNHTYTLNQGDAYFINTNVMNTKKMTAGYSQAVEHAHLFHPILLSGHFHSVYQIRYLNPILKNQQIEVLIIKDSTETGRKYLQVLKKLTRLHELPHQEMQIRNLLSDAWLLLMAESQNQLKQMHVPKKYKQDTLRSMLSYIHSNYHQDITLAAIADYANISERECSRLFKTVIKKSPFEYILEHRIAAAKNMLEKTDASVTDISISVGFSSSAYFGKVFKRHTGVTPKEFRQIRSDFHSPTCSPPGRKHPTAPPALPE